MAIFRGTGGSGDSTNDATVSQVTQKAVEAAQSAADALSSANAAAGSATAAQTAQTAAEAAQSASETAQANSETAQTAAETAKTGAETAQTAAETAQASAETAYDDFDDRYLGAKSSAPSTDNDGDALLDGALYFDTTDNVFYGWNGTTWIALGAELSLDASPQLSADLDLNTHDITGTGNINITGTVNERNLVNDGSKLDGIETGATADQTDSEIKTAYENNLDTNAFTDAEQTKLSGIETGATADQTASEILTAIKTVDGTGSGLDADLLDGNEASAFATSAQGATADSALQNVSEDTTPTLGGNLDVDSNRLNNTGYVAFTSQGSHPAYEEGLLWYDSIHNTLNYYGDESGIVHEIGLEEHQKGYNNSGVTISKGEPIYFSGNFNGYPTFAKANATDVGKYNAQGIAGHDIANNSYGYVVTAGLVEDVDTSGLSAGTNFFVGLTDGAVQNASPTYPNYPMCLGWVVNSDATNGILLVNQQNHSVRSFRVQTDTHIGGDLIIDGDLTVVGSQTISSSTNVETGAPFLYLNSGDSIGEAGTTFTGSGLDDAYFAGHFNGTASTTYYVKIDATGTPDTFSWSKDNFSTTEATGVAITGGEQALGDGIAIDFGATTGHTLNDVWSGTAAPVDADTGFWSNRNTGGTGVGYTHVGMFYDVSDNKFKLVDEYDPEPTGVINTSDNSFSAGTIVADGFEGSSLNVSGNIVVGGTVDGRDVATDGLKLDGIPSNATANPNALDNVSEDTSPELGGTLDTNGNLIKFGDSTGDANNRLVFGAGDDFTIHHDSGGTDLSNKTEDLVIVNYADDKDVVIRTDNGSGGVTDYIICKGASGAVELKYFGSAKIKTTSTGGDINGNLTVSGTVDGRDVNADGTKLDGIESGATADQTAQEIATAIDGDATAEATLKTALGLGSAAYTNSSDYATVAQGTTADNALPKAGGTMTGDIVFNAGQTFDGRDVSADGTKLDGIEANADVTDATNVEAAGALMDSEVTNLADVKAFDPADYATAAQGTTADSAMQDLVDDTTPQLGGDLDANGHNIKIDGGNKLYFQADGTIFSNFLEYNTTYNQSQLQNDANFTINVPLDGRFLVGHGGIGNPNFKSSIKAIPNSAVELYHNNVKKFETQSTGVSVTGDIAVSGNVDGRDVSADGTKLDGIASSATANPNAIDNLVEDTTPQLGGNLDTNSNHILFDTSHYLIWGTNPNIGTNVSVEGFNSSLNLNLPSGNTLNIWDRNLGQNLKYSGTFNPAGAVSLYYDSSKKFETTANGIEVTGDADIGPSAIVVDIAPNSTPRNVIETSGGDAIVQTVNNSGNVRTDIYGTFNGINTVGLKVGSNYVTVPGNFSIGDGAITFPTSDGTNGQVLTTDGSGTLSFQTPSGGSGGTSTGKTLVFANLFG